MLPPATPLPTPLPPPPPPFRQRPQFGGHGSSRRLRWRRRRFTALRTAFGAVNTHLFFVSVQAINRIIQMPDENPESSALSKMWSPEGEIHKQSSASRTGAGFTA